MFEAYKIGIRLSLVNHVSSGLVSIISQFKTLHGDSALLKKQLNEIKLLGVAGAAVGGVGFMGLGLVAKTINPANEYIHQLALMNTAGMKHLDIINATSAAWGATKMVPTSSVSENLEAIRDLRMVFGGTKHAIEYMPTLQKIQGVLSNVRHGAGPGAVRAEAYELAKALEMKGAVRHPEEFVSQADMMTKALVAAGGKVNATDFLSAFKYGRAATSGWNNDFTYKILPTLIQEMKGGGGTTTGGPGSALMSAYAAVVGGVVSQRALKTWEKIGLLDPSKIEWTKVHEAKGIRPGGILGSDMFQQNPFDWSQKFLIPALQKAGYLTEAQQKQALQYLFPNRTAGFVMSQFVTQAWKFERDKKLIDQAHGLAGYNDLLKDDPIMAQMALQKQWNSLLAILGYQIMPPFIKGLQMTIDVTRKASNLLKEHSTLAKALVGGFVALSGAMAISGTIMMLAGGIRAVGLVLPLIKPMASIIAPLISTTTGFPALAVGLTALLGVATGTLANNVINRFTKWATNGKEDTLGGWIWSLTHWENTGKSTWPGSDDWRNHIETVKPRNNNKPIQVNSRISLDGRQIASVVTTHQANESERPQGGLSGAFDSILTPIPVGY